MKISLTSDRRNLKPFDNGPLASSKRCSHGGPPRASRMAAFTMMEIAICLAIIGIALVAIIGVLPIGMNVQQDNRQQTIIAQDASVLTDAIRNGQLGLDDLTNYVYAISNYWAEYDTIANGGKVLQSGVNGFTYSGSFVAPSYYFTPAQGSPLPTAQTSSAF